MKTRVVLVLGVLIMAILSQTAKWKGAVIQRQPPQANAWVAPGAYRHWELTMREWQTEQLATEGVTKRDQPHFLYRPTDVLPERPRIPTRRPNFSTETEVLTPMAPSLSPFFGVNRPSIIQGSVKQPDFVKRPRHPAYYAEPEEENGAAKQPGFTKEPSVISTPQIIGSTTTDEWTIRPELY